MKYIKKFENISNAKEGDYVLCGNVDDDNKYFVSQRWQDYNDFLEKNIGQVIYKGGNYFIVMFDVDIPIDVLEYAFLKKLNIRVLMKGLKFYAKRHLIKFKNGISNLVSIQDEEIVEYSNNREDLEAILDAKKYNI